MHSEYLSKVAKHCYKEKHVQDEWTNMEQIELCRKLVKDEIMGDFESSLVAHRNKDAYNVQQCFHEAKNNVGRAFKWIDKYHADMDKTNERIANEFKEKYVKYF